MRPVAAAFMLTGWLCATPLLAAEALSRERQREILREALDAFDDAVGRARSDAPAAEALLRKAAGGFEALIEAGLRNAALEYNLANTYFRLHDSGRAVLHYRRAQRLAPGDAQIAANLRYARERVEPYLRPSGRRELLGRLLFWNRSLSMERRFWIAVLASALGWLGLTAWLRWRSRPLAVGAALLIGLGLANAGSVAWQLHEEGVYPPAVIVQPDQILRLGRGEGYEPAISQRLGAGVEVRILQQRGDWAEVRLVNDQTGWLPALVLERI